MAFRTSPALLAAMMAIAVPAFAQDSTQQPTVPSTLPESLDAAGQEAADSITNGAPATTTNDTTVTVESGEAAPAAGSAETAPAATETAPAETAPAEAAPATAPAETPATDAPAATAETPAAETPAADAPAAPAADAPAAPAADAPAADPAATPAAPAADAAAPAAASGEPAVGQNYIRSTHTDWVVRCLKAQQGVDPCELYQLMKDGEGNSVAEISMIPLNGDVVAGATLVAPLETDLIAAITFTVDNSKPRVYPFNFCTQIGCISRLGFTPDELAGLKRGNKATVMLLPFGGDPKNPVTLDMSLSGFTAAFDELQTIAAEARAAAEAAPAAEAPAADAPAADGAADGAAAEEPAAEAAPASN